MTKRRARRHYHGGWRPCRACQIAESRREHQKDEEDKARIDEEWQLLRGQRRYGRRLWLLLRGATPFGDWRDEWYTTLGNVLAYVVLLTALVFWGIKCVPPPDYGNDPQHHCRYDPRYGDDC